MFVIGSSPPPQDLPSLPESTSVTPAPSVGGGHLAVNNSNGNTVSRSSVPPTTHGRKRKRGQATASTSHAASPAPSEQGTTAANGHGNDLLATRGDLSSRPHLSISRGPLFHPIAEGSEYHKTDFHGVNQKGFRYTPAGIVDTPVRFRTIESAPTSFRISWEDRSPQIRVTKDGLGLMGYRGFRSARCNAPVREGKWYVEVKILDAGDSTEGQGNHVRLGWGRREASLSGPVGWDGYSYGYRDKTGEKVAISRPKPYGKPFRTGDVVGMYISLPPLRKPNKKDPLDPAHLHRERIAIDFKGQELFELQEYPVTNEMAALMNSTGKTKEDSASVPSTNMKKSASSGAGPPPASATTTSPSKQKSKQARPLRPLPTLPNSRIAFFLNGECQGTAFEDLYDFLPLRQTEEERKKTKEKSKSRFRDGMKVHIDNFFDDGTLGYYPMISLFNDARVHINPGPVFDYPPPRDIDPLLDGKPPSDTQLTPSTEPGAMKVDPSPVKAEHEPVSLEEQTHESAMDVDRTTELSSCATWRPILHRYPEFMQEQWALDAIEEEEAKIEFEKLLKAESAPKTKKKPGTATGRAKASGGADKKGGGKKKTGAGATPEATTGMQQEGSVLKKSKTSKAAGQAALGMSSPTPNPPSSQQPAASQPISTPARSETQTPCGTPPPPTVSGNAAAVASAAVQQLHSGLQHPHALHYSLARSESVQSGRPSPSPLRHSTTSSIPSHRDETHVHVSLPGPPSGSAAGLVSRRPPGSQQGRHHAQLAAAAAATDLTMLTPGWNRGHAPSTLTATPLAQRQPPTSPSRQELHAASFETVSQTSGQRRLIGPGIRGDLHVHAPGSGYDRSSTINARGHGEDHNMEDEDDDFADAVDARSARPDGGISSPEPYGKGARGGDESDDEIGRMVDGLEQDEGDQATSDGDDLGGDARDDIESEDQDETDDRHRRHRQQDDLEDDADGFAMAVADVDDAEETDDGTVGDIGIEIEAHTASRTTSCSRSPPSR